MAATSFSGHPPASPPCVYHYTSHLLHHLPWFTMSGQHLNIETYFNHHLTQHFPIDFTQPLSTPRRAQRAQRALRCQALWCSMLMHPGLPLVGEALVNHPSEKKGTSRHPAGGITPRVHWKNSGMKVGWNAEMCWLKHPIYIYLYIYIYMWIFLHQFKEQMLMYGQNINCDGR